MPGESVQPLRIQKNSSLRSPGKMGSPVVPRPLSEVGPMERRRNSPSFNQATKKMMFNGDSSPFDSSPFTSNSPHLFWKERDTGSPNPLSENNTPFGRRDSSRSPTRRGSIEKLQQASRVKNSNMFAREQKQEPSPGRPLSFQMQGNAFNGHGLEGFRKGHRRGESSNAIPAISPSKTPTKVDTGSSFSFTPSKDQASPTKSSLSNRHRFTGAGAGADPEEDEDLTQRQLPPGKILHRRGKSVTFDAAPPQINEYEMTTPDLSSVASESRDGSDGSDEEDAEDGSFTRSFSIDRDDSFDASLEDTEKTPVVLPEDWRHMSPGMAIDTLASQIEDPFDGDQNSPHATALPTPNSESRPSPIRTDSGSSSSERRPLPPLPGLEIQSKSSSSPSDVDAPKVDSLRGLPSPPGPASVSKAELQGFGGSRMPLEERLRLMMLQDNEKMSSPSEVSSRSPNESQRERRMRRANSKEKSQETFDNNDGLGIQINQHEAAGVDSIDWESERLPRISRESILRKVKGQKEEEEIGKDNNNNVLDIDPDVPIPSLEDYSALDFDNSVIINRPDDDGSDIDVYSITDMYQDEDMGMYDGDGSVIHHDVQSSHHEHEEKAAVEGTTKAEISKAAENHDDRVPTIMADAQKLESAMSLPEFGAMDDFGLGLRSYMSQSPPDRAKQMDRGETKDTHLGETSSQRPSTPQRPPRTQSGDYDEKFDLDPRTPELAGHHVIKDVQVGDSPGVPEPIATIKASGAKLKTRPSITPADFRTMAETRRKVSREEDIPPVPERHPDRPSSLSREVSQNSIQRDEDLDVEPTSPEDEGNKTEGRRQSLVKLDMPVDSLGDDLGLGLDREFDRVIEAQKVVFDLFLSQSNLFHQNCSARAAEAEVPSNDSVQITNTTFRKQRGYLMRQNTKVIVASSDSREAAAPDGSTDDVSARKGAPGTSPRKTSDDKTKAWTSEPWNGKMRRKSIRQTGGSPQKRAAGGPAPPLPGQSSNVSAGLQTVAEDELLTKAESEEEDGERGRLFVKVVGVKDLALPLPKGERTWFCLTLDNGLHCVTTAWLELGKNAPIGQEFELVVLNDLEFQLTLQAKLEKPAPIPAPASPTKRDTPKAASALSRVFGSPKKRKDSERKQIESERASNQCDGRVATQQTAWDLLHGLVARDGSFARSYVCLKDHEDKAYGRPYKAEVACFNEWATETSTINSSKSKRSTGTPQLQRKAPYKIGRLELQLLFVPKPKGATDNDMPRSMNACIREITEAEARVGRTFEGHLSQQGGDCPYWRRRFFRLDGSKLTAYHEATLQPRATINLAKASRLIDDKSALTQKEVSGKGRSRRKSAFAEDEEGYMFVEEGFRIKFANGETIDFYADNTEDKEAWMKVLGDTIGKGSSGPAWTDLVLARERLRLMPPVRKPAQPQLKPAGTHSVPSSPSRHPQPPPPIQKSPRHQPGVGHGQQMKSTTGMRPKSMVF